MRIVFDASFDAAAWPGPLAALATVTAPAFPGVPGRVAAVADALRRRPADLDEIELLAPDVDLRTLWRAVLERLVAQGTRVTTKILPPTDARGDLAAAR